MVNLPERPAGALPEIGQMVTPLKSRLLLAETKIF